MNDLDPPVLHRTARNGTLVLGGGFGGASLARLLGRAGATIVNPTGSMLYTPLLPEVAAGGIEPRHAVVPLRRTCPHAELVRGEVIGLDRLARKATIATGVGRVEIAYERLVVALGATARMLPVPGLAEHALTFKSVGDAIGLRNHALTQLEHADLDPADAERHLSFVVIGGGYAGVEALAEVRQLVDDTLRHQPRLRDVTPRFVLVEAGPRILGEVPGRLGEHATDRLRREGIDVLTGTTLAEVGDGWVALSDGQRLTAGTVVWAAGIVPAPMVARLGLPLDERGRVRVDERMQVLGRPDIWALGDCAAVPNAATPGRVDPPTCQHALRQARRLAKVLRGSPKPYRYRSIGQGATLGRLKGVALLGRFTVRGVFGAVVVRWYHVAQVPLASRAIRIAADSLLSLVFRRDGAELPVGITPVGPPARTPDRTSAAA